MKFIERFSRKASVRPVAAGDSRPPLLMALEPRIMFDASVGVVAEQAAQATAEPAKDSTSSDQASVPAASADTRPSQNGPRQEVVFVDGQVANVAELLQGLSGNPEVVILDSSKDGLQQMADYLKGREGLDAVHLLSHGADGNVQVGNVWLAGYNLAEHRAALESIGAALKADGDLMLYGCKVGETERGQAFLDELASITGADVAASADDTGAAILGGNWTLERSVGSIEASALGAQLQGYTAVMAAQFSGGSDSNAPVLGVGALSRMVVGDFNNDGRADILFQTSNVGNAPWKFAAGTFGGGFTIVDRTDGTSPFRNITTMIDMANTGSNYYAADFDRDGDIDLLGVTATLGTAVLYRNDNGVFTSATPTGFGGAQFGSRLVVGDFNGDGAADILYQPGTVNLLSSWFYAVNNGNGTFNEVAQNASPFAAFNLPPYSNFNYRVIDFEGDGDLDIIYMAAANPASLFLNNGSGVFSLGAGGNIPIATFSQRSIFGDFDGDGDADMFWQIGANGTEWNYAENLGNGSFAATVTRADSPFKNLIMVNFSTTNFRIGDFDGDGDTDLIGSFAGVGASVYYQDGTSPRLVSSTPADNSGAVSPSANIVLTFDQAVLKGSGDIKIVRISDNQVIQSIAVGSGAVTGSGTTWTIDTPSDLAAGVAYAVRIDSKAFVNASGRVYMGIQTNTALNFVIANIASPVITDLNGDTVAYTEGVTALPIDKDGNATVTDLDSVNFNGGTLTIAISSGGVSSEDVLGIINVGSGATQIGVSGNVVSYGGNAIGTFAGGTLGNALVVTFNSGATPVAVSALLHQLSYTNSNTGDIGTASRNVQVTITDGTGGTSAVSNITVAMTPVNDAPTATATALAPTFTEGGAAVALFSNTSISTVEAGQKVSQIIFRVLGMTDIGSEKLNIDGMNVSLTHGNSVTTSTHGLSISVVVVGGTAFVTVDSSAGLTTATAGSIVDGVTYANDSNAPTGSRTVFLYTLRDDGGTANGGADATNVAISSAITLVAVNDAPTLSGGPFVLTGTNEDTTSTGTLISTVLAGLTYSDPDASPLLGAAITATSGSGNWQFSINGTTGWTSFNTVSNSNALLLTGSTSVRYVPNGANGETATLTLRAWDQTSGTASTAGIARTADTSTSGGSTAFSSGTAVASMTVTHVNDAPVLSGASPTLPGLSDDAVNNSGVLVSSLYTANYTDVDTGALNGIAITSLNSGNGTWQYSHDGTTWNNVGVVTVSTALLLRATDHVRFVPDGLNGTTADFTFRAWDQTGATNGLYGTQYDASVAGGTTAFSTLLDTASITVTAVNDAPILTGSGGNLTWTEGNNTTSIPVVIDNALTISDADGPHIASATVRISNNYSNGNDYLELVSNPATMGNIVGSWDAANATLTLTSAGNIASLAQFQAALRAVTFTNLAESPAPQTRTVQFRVNDGSLDSAGVTRDINMIVVDDTPVISASASTLVVEDVASVINQISISDPDSINIFMTLSVTSGTLAATSGAGVVVGGNSSAMNLSGTLIAVNAFIANNRLTYTTAANATADATLTIVVNTGSVSNDTRTMTLAVTPVNDAPVATVPVSIAVTEDLASSLTGISFSDVDAGSASVTATFSVTSGTLSALSGSGVTVADSGTATLTLSGSLSDINAFIAAAGVKFQTALDSAGSLLLTVSINDNANIGGSAQTDTKIVIINVIAVNDAPVNAVPGDQSVKQDAVLTFNSANGNLVSISDVDSGGAPLIVTLTATNGLITLSSTLGLAFHNGNVPGTSTLEFEGTLAQINAALNGMTFTPTPGYNGPASFTIISNDNGASGSGGVLSDTDSFNITVQPLNPGVTHVSILEGDRAYKVGETLNVAVTFDMNVNVAGGVPTLLLETGATDRFATYVSGSGTNSLIFSYTVQAGDVSADLDYQNIGALQLNGATIKSTGSDDAVRTLPGLGGADSIAGQKAIVIDGVVPTVSNVVVPSDGTYIVGQNLDFTVNFSENVVVSTVGGTPRIAVTLDTGGTVYADYVSGSGGSALVFRLTVASGQLDSNGISLGSALQLNGGSIRDGAGNDTQTTLSNVASTLDVDIDGVVPAVVSVATPGDGSYKAGDVLTFTVNAGEALQTGALPPRLVLNVGGVTRYATYVSGSGSSALVFQYTVQAGDSDGDGIALNSIDLRGESLTDLAGNALDLNLNGVGSVGNVLIDTTLPTAGNLLRVDASPSNSGAVSYTLTFSENVSGVDTSDFNLFFTGTASGNITSVTQVDGRTYTVVIDAIGGAGTLRLDLKASGTGIADAAGNAVIGGLTGASYGIDRAAPSVVGVDVPANGTYVAGENLDFTVHLDEVVQLSVVNGTPRIEVLLDNGTTAYATYLSGTGTNALVFRLTVANGQLDTNGITLGSGIQLNGGTLRDSLGNDANVALNGVDDSSQVRVDALVPTVSTVGLPAPGAYNAGEVLRFTVNVSETVNVDTSTGTPRVALNIGGLTRYANYVSGTGSNALVFEYTVEAGNNAAGGIGLAGTLDLNGGTVRDAAGNALNPGLNTPGLAGGVVVDTEAPQIGNIVRVGLGSTNSSSVRYTVTFNEDVTGVDSADFSLAFTGSASGRLASVEQVNSRTYTIVVDNLTGAGNVRLDLSATGTGIVDVAGNPITGGLQGAVYSIDRVAPSVSSVDVPASGTYVAGQQLDFTVRTHETVLVDSGDGNPRLAITLDNGRVVYADYLSGSGGNALLFRLNVTSGLSGNSTFNVGSAIDLNGGSIRDVQGNDVQAGLNNVADTRGILLDAKAPRPSSIVVDGPLQPSDSTLNFTLTFDEAVSGVDANDFSVVGTGNASGSMQSVQQIDAKTYRITVGNISGAGALALSLNALGSGIRDQAGNGLAVSLIGQSQTLQSQDVGDLNFRLNPPETLNTQQTVVVQPQVPGFVTREVVSPLAAPGLFEVRTVGGNLLPLGTIFIGDGSSAPSFIAQVFGSSDTGVGGQSGFLGFGGGDSGVFGSSTFAGIFSRDVPGISEMNVFDGSQWKQSDLNQGLRGVFGAPTLGQQLHRINEADQRQVRELAMALAQPAQIGKRA